MCWPWPHPPEKRFCQYIGVAPSTFTWYTSMVQSLTVAIMCITHCSSISIFFLHEKEEALKFAGPDPFVPEIDERPDGEGCHRIFKERVLPLALLSVS